MMFVLSSHSGADIMCRLIRYASLFVLLCSFVLIWSSMPASAQAKADVFIGYSFTSSDVRFFEGGGSHSDRSVGRAALNGWDASASLKLVRFIRGVIDLGGGYGTLPVVFTGFGFPDQKVSVSANLHTYLLGPRFVLSRAKLTPFAHVLVGLAHQSLPANASSANAPQRDSAFAVDLGGGIDIPLISRVAGRIEADYLQTTLLGATQHIPRIIAGVAFRF
jgi:uncharacterized membrane protein YfcA